MSRRLNSLERKNDPCKSDSQHFTLFEKLVEQSKRQNWHNWLNWPIYRGHGWSNQTLWIDHNWPNWPNWPISRGLGWSNQNVRIDHNWPNWPNWPISWGHGWSNQNFRIDHNWPNWPYWPISRGYEWSNQNVRIDHNWPNWPNWLISRGRSNLGKVIMIDITVEVRAVLKTKDNWKYYCAYKCQLYFSREGGALNTTKNVQLMIKTWFSNIHSGIQDLE